MSGEQIRTSASILAVAVLAVIAWQVTVIANKVTEPPPPPPPEPPPPRFEYKVTAIDDSYFTDQMAQYGEQGWRLVSARRAIDSVTNDANYEVIFTRELPPAPVAVQASP